MERPASGPFRSTVTRDQLERELELIREAVAMVSAGGASRVTVAGIRFGEELLPAATAEARDLGVTIEALWKSDETGCDLWVHRTDA